MAENIHIDLSDELESDLSGSYQSLCDGVAGELSSLISELGELCNKTQFEPMVRTVNDTVALFNEKIYAVSNQIFEEWTEGDGSFPAAAANSQAGDNAVETARGIESKLRGIFDSFWSSNPMREGVQADTRQPKVEDEDFETMKDLYTKFFQNVEEIGTEAINQITEKGSDDPTYNVAIPAFKAITEPMQNAFEEFCTKIDEAKDDSMSLKQQQDEKNDLASEAATTTSASAADIAEALQMFDDV